MVQLPLLLLGFCRASGGFPETEKETKSTAWVTPFSTPTQSSRTQQIPAQSQAWRVWVRILTHPEPFLPRLPPCKDENHKAHLPPLLTAK